MSKYKICVYAICKNEEKFVDRWMEAVSEADLVVVLDTGSTDDTVKKLKAAGAKVYSKKIDPWRFDTARNAAMKLIPKNYDICVSNDLDEIFEKGWRQKLENAWSDEHTRARYSFVWSHNEDGSPQKIFDMEKIHARKDFAWVHPVHEVLKYSGTKPDKTLVIPEIILHHYPDNTKPRSQYLPLLELSAEENPTDDRTIFWLGREYFFYKKYDKAIRTLKRYLQLPTAVWSEERSAAMRYISKAYAGLHNFTQERKWLIRAAAECPEVREPFLALAKLGYSESDWVLVLWAVTEGLKVVSSTGSYLLEPAAWGSALYDLGSIAAYRLGNLEISYQYAQIACKLDPEDERLKNNLELIRKAKENELG